MDDELNAMLEAWEAPAVSDGFDARMEDLFSSPPAEAEPGRQALLWPVVAFGGCVALLVWTTAVGVRQGEPRVVVPDRGEAVAAGTATDARGATAQTQVLRARAGQPVGHVPLVSRVVLEGYVAIPSSEIVVERRSR